MASKQVPAKSQVEPTAASAHPSGPDWFDLLSGDWPLESWPFVRLLPELRRAGPAAGGALRVEEFTEGDEQVVRAEMPGIDPDRDVEIQVADNRLYLRAERRQQTSVEKGGARRTEFHYGSFTRSVPLAPGATEKDVKATYKDGILEVRIAMKREAARTTKIPVQRA